MAPNRTKVGGVTKQTFMEADEHTKDGLLFDMLAGIEENTVTKIEEVKKALVSCQDNRTKVVGEFNDRVGKLEKKKKTDTAVASGSGIIGGFLAMLVRKIFWD